MSVNIGHSYFSFSQWDKELEEKEKREREEREKKRIEREKYYKEQMDLAMKKYNGYWYYKEADVYVPLSFGRIHSLSSINSRSIMFLGNDGTVTQTESQLGGGFTYTKDKYRDYFCEYNKDKDRWEYIGDNQIDM